MQKIIMTKGLPASGKDSWAKEFIKINTNFKRVNKDLLREMIDFSCFSKKNEKFVLKIRDEFINQALQNGYSVIVSDTNFAPKHEETLRELAILHDVDFEINDSFMEVDVDTCIERDLKRGDASVGQKVILDMYYRYIHKEDFYHIENKSLSNCVIVDIDGTIAEKKGRSPYDMTRVLEDTPKQNIIDLVRLLSQDNEIIFFSGREDSAFEDTKHWIRKYVFPGSCEPINLYMRREGDNRADWIIKQDLFLEHISKKYNPKLIIDDRRQVVDVWRKMGLTCLEVADHRF